MMKQMSAPLLQKGHGPGMPVMPPQQQPQTHMPPGLAQPGMPPQGALREISPVYLCRIGQETVQDIVTRTMEIFQITRATQLPNGVTQSQAAYQDRFGKLQEHLRQLTLLFRKLRLLYERCVEMTPDLQESPAELVPYVGEETTPVRVEPCSPAVILERQEVLEKVRQKNQEMKVLMDQMRNLLWDVNAMLTMRK
ncbi:mediator of RNA polymerase II transcription subunit 30-like isoform X1 [Sinocyclocheilus rhinocerous]|nr:PREDICTED: mediator of RNA polymerase II transcription subunit 30-like isoform X1 [Sinocyclocheilus rhinocerous]